MSVNSAEFSAARIRHCRLVHAARRGMRQQVEAELRTVTADEIAITEAAKLVQAGRSDEAFRGLLERFTEMFGEWQDEGADDLPDNVGSLPITELDIPVEWIAELERVLNNREPMSVGQLLGHTPEAIIKIRKIGKKGWREIRRVLNELGLGSA